MSSTGRRLWRWIAGTAATVLILAAVLTGALRVALEQVPGYQAEIASRVRAATGLTLRFRSLDARLGWYGPEVWFDGAEVLDRDGREVLVSAEGGSVSLSVPRSIWHRRIEVGRVLLERPQLNFLIFPDRHLELVGQPSLRQPPRNGRTLEPDRLPRGRLEIRDAVIAFVDLRPGYAPWRVEGVTLAIERRGRRLSADGHVELPRRFGGTLDFEGLATGDLARPRDLAWRVNGSARALDFSRWGDLLPGQFEPPSAGRGSLRLEAEGRGPVLADATFRYALTGVVLPSVTDAPPAAYRTLAGELHVEQRNGTWTLDGRDLRFDLEDSPWKASDLHARAEVSSGRLQTLELRAPFLKLENLVPLLNLVPPSQARNVVLALDPSGELDDVDLVATGFTAGRLPEASGSMRFRDVGIAPTGSRPGVRGLDGELRARGGHGEVTLHTRDLTMTWPAQWRAIAAASEFDAVGGWRQADDGMRVWADDVRLDVVGLHATARLRMYFAGGDESPLMDLTARVTDGDVTQAWRYLPIGRMTPKSLAWVDAAFRAGRIPEARVEITGPIRGFPYRDGQGRFFADGRMQDVTLNYVNDWPLATGVAGEFEFRNTSLSVRNATGRLGGITVGSAEAHIDDWRQTILTVNASAMGDLGAALGYLQASPLREYFKGLSGTGSARGEAVLYLPLKDMPSKSIVVHAGVSNGSLGMAGQAERLTRLAGTLWTRNREIFARSVTGEFLGGGLAGRVDTRAGDGGNLLTTADFSGTFEGERLQALAKLPVNSGLSGGTDWHAALRAERPAEAGAPGRYRIEVDSTLAGLASGLPEPLRKAAGEAKPLHAEVTLPRPGVFQVQASLAPDTRAAIEWRRELQGYQLARGLVRFGPGAAPALPDGDGLRLVGRLARASLTDVLNLRSAQPSKRHVQDWLTNIDLDVAEPEVLGYRFDRVRAAVVPGDLAWRVDVQGETARGRVLVPFDFAGTLPLTVDMDILHVGDRVRSGTGNADPRRLPSISFDVRDLEFDGRRFGRLTADVARTPDGLVAERLEARHPAFVARGRGSWIVAGDAQRSMAVVDADSTDIAATLAAMGYGPWVEAKKGTVHAELSWPGAPDGSFLERSSGKIGVSISDGRIPRVEPGAGRVLGLMSLTHLPQRLALDFKDLTGEGLAFDSIRGDFNVHDGDAYTNNMTLRGPAAEIGLAGRTSFRTREYDQTVVVTGELGASLGVAGVLAGGPAIGAALLLFSQMFKEPLKGMTRGYYHITGTWDAPLVQPMTAAAARDSRRDAPAPVPAPGGPG